jgi:hypothetical protein
MKNLFVLLITALAFSACKKDVVKKNNEIIIEPYFDRLISRDTITNGQKFGFIIGKSSAEIYSTIRETRTQQNITFLGVVGNIFTNVDSLKNRLSLYQSVYLDQQVGTNTGIQIAFETDKVSGIWTNNGDKLKRWPTSGSTYITSGDPVANVYIKLASIQKMPAYANKFERISIFFKDTSKGYDAQMAYAPEWYYNANIDDKHYNSVHLNFKAGVLVSIYSALFERGGK